MLIKERKGKFYQLVWTALTLLASPFSFLHTSFFKVTLLKPFCFRGQINHEAESNIDDVKLCQGH